MVVESNKTLGFVGTLLSAIGSIGSYFSLGQLSTAFIGLAVLSIVFSLIGFVGFILFMVTMYGFSKDYRDSGIFNNVLYGFISTIIGVVITMVVTFFLTIVNIGRYFSTHDPFYPLQTSITSELYGDLFGYLLPALIAGTVVALICALFYQRAFNKIAAKSEVQTFQTVGLLTVIASVLNIIAVSVAGLLVYTVSLTATAVPLMVVVGNTVLLVAWLLASNAFRVIKKPESTSMPPLPLPAYSSSGPLVRVCPACGAENKFSDVYCARCGKRI